MEQKMTTQASDPQDEVNGLIQLWNWNLSFHELNEEGIDKTTKLRNHYIRLAQKLIKTAPMGRELNLALTDLERSMNTALQAIARKYTDDGTTIHRTTIRKEILGEVLKGNDGTATTS